MTKMSKINIEVEVTEVDETKGKTTHIICVLDRSGSMGGETREVIRNFNEFLKVQQELEGKAKLTLVIFDTEYDVIYDEVNIKKVKPLTSRTYFARGGTAMNDAIGRILTEKQSKKKAIVLIHTDGHENASREFSAKQIKKLVKNLKKKWEFIFVGAGMDAMTANKSYGFTHTLNASNNAQSYDNQYDMFSSVTANYRSVGMAGAAATACFVAEAAANETTTTVSGDPDDPMTYVDLNINTAK